MENKKLTTEPEDFFSYAKKLNPKCESLTPEKLRSFPGCENYTDEEANNIINTLAQYATILFENAENKFIADGRDV